MDYSMISGIVMILFWVFVIFLFLFGNSLFDNFCKLKQKENKNIYGYKNNKCIDIDNVPVFRDIPCNGDIYYAYTLIKLNNFKIKNVNILVAIILKWVKENKIVIRKIKNVKIIDLTLNLKFNDSEFENNLFKMMYEASNDGFLGINEFTEWAKNYDMRFLGLFARLETEIINYLKKETHIYHRITKDECKKLYVMDDKIYNDSIELYGFKKFLEDFSLMDNKEFKELHLWEDYLIFAALFGFSDKVNMQFKELCPDLDEIDKFDLI